MPDGVPTAVTVTAILLAAVLFLAAAHVFLTSGMSPIQTWRPDLGGKNGLTAACLFLYFIGLLSSAAALLEEWAELDTFAADALRCARDVALVAAGHACWPLASLLVDSTVWRRTTTVSWALSRACSEKWRVHAAVLTGASFVLSAAATIAWPQPQPWRIQPAPPLRTALIALPGAVLPCTPVDDPGVCGSLVVVELTRGSAVCLSGPIIFACVLLLTVCYGASPWGETMSILGSTLCVFGAVVVTLVPWQEGQVSAIW
jgi:hypothetical protein